jgi:diguanylate cyclase (GGDEF)-like protein/PAS domain S-box-containing protein
MTERHNARGNKPSSDKRPLDVEAQGEAKASAANQPSKLRNLAVPASVLTGMLLFNLFVIANTVLSLRSSREQYHDQAEVTTRNIAQILAEYTAGLVTNADGALFSVCDEYTRQLATGKVDSQALNAYIARRHAQVPFLDAIRVSDARGYITHGTGVDPGLRVNIGDREYFTRLRDTAHPGLVISKPMLGRVSGKWVVVLARRVNSPAGTFAGIAWGAIDLEKYAEVLSRVEVGVHGAVSLRDQDMALLAHHPQTENSDMEVGSRTVSPALHRLIEAGAASATYDTPNPADNVPRTVTFRKVDDRPLYIIVGLAPDDYLAPWRKQVIRATAAVATFLGITLLLFVLFFKYWGRHVASVQQLVDQEAKFRIVADFAYEWEYWEGPDRKLLYISPSCEQITGYSRADFEANPGLLYHIIHPEDRAVLEAHTSNLADREEGQAEFRIVRRDGGIRWIAHGCRPVFDSSGSYQGRRASNRDITEMVQLHDELKKLARTDNLTGLANRRAFVEAAQAEFERLKRYGSEATLLMMDVDHFKKVNDHYGHGAGDRALVALAQVLKTAARSTDLPARFGGEEFLLLLANTNLPGAMIIAERVRLAIAEIVTKSTLEGFGLTVSIGAASFDKGDTDWSDVVRKADKAMYRAKELGRNRVVAFSELAESELRREIQHTPL